MKKSAWHDLPNAHHIDRIFAHLKANPDKWNAARDAAWNAATGAAMGAILALMAWDDCAYLLDQKPEHVKIIALLGHEASILLEPAVIAMYEETLETV